MLILYKGVLGTLFGLAILTATIRTVYRVQSNGRLMLDDFMLIFACVTLTAANGILFSLITTVYWHEDLILNPHPLATKTPSSPSTFSARLLRYQQLLFSFATLIWTTIFAVKICFLLFFLQMVHRLQKLMLIWKIVFGITVLFYCICVTSLFISCHHFGFPACQSGPFP